MVLLVLVLVIGAVGVGAELLLRSQVGRVVRTALPGLSRDAEVSTEGVLLAQLASGSLRSLEVEAGSLDLQGSGGGASGGSDGAEGATSLEEMTLSDVSAKVSQVSLRSPYTASRIEASGTVAWDQVAELVGQSAPGLAGATVSAGQPGTSKEDPGTIMVQTNAFGVEGNAEVAPSVGQDGGLVLTVQAVTTAGARTEVGADGGAEADYLLGSLGLDSSQVSVPAEELPQGLTVSQVRVTDGGLQIGLAGSDVDLAGM